MNETLAALSVLLLDLNLELAFWERRLGGDRITRRDLLEYKIQEVTKRIKEVQNQGVLRTNA